MSNPIVHLSVNELRDLLIAFAQKVDIRYYQSAELANKFLTHEGFITEPCKHLNKVPEYNSNKTIIFPGRYTCLDCRESVYIHEEAKGKEKGIWVK